MAGRPKKADTASKTTEKAVENTDKTTEKDDSQALIAQLMAQIEELQKQIATPQPVVIQQTESKLGAKKIKCVNLSHQMVNICNEPNGTGNKTVEFEDYGDTRLVRFDDLADMVACYPNTFEKGMIYIADSEAVEALGLSEVYEEINDPSTLKDVVKMNTQMAYDIFMGMCDEMKRSYAKAIAKRINAKERVDLNLIRDIKYNTDIDIEEIARNIEESTKRLEDEN